MNIKLHDNLYIPENFEEKHEYYADPEGKKKYTGCTTILNVLSKPALVPWAARMAVEYLYDNAEIYRVCDADEPAPSGVFTQYLISSTQLEKAKTAYAKKRDEGAQKGTDTHALVEAYVNDCILTNEGKPFAVVKQEAESIQPFASWALRENIKFISAETPLVSEKLWVAGTADLIFEKDGKRYIGDIKTYKKIWDRTPFYQCAGYALMYEEMNTPLKEMGGLELTPPKQIDGYCIINLPKERDFNEEQDVMWSFDTEGDTRAFLACVELYKQNRQFVSPKVSYKKK